jgi:hypothetical protein
MRESMSTTLIAEPAETLELSLEELDRILETEVVDTVPTIINTQDPRSTHPMSTTLIAEPVETLELSLEELDRILEIEVVDTVPTMVNTPG